jgi:UPF0755 protein
MNEQTPQPSRSLKLLVAFAFLAICALIAVGAVTYSFSVYSAPRNFIEPEKTVVIKPGTGGRAILRQLHAEGILPPPWLITAPMMLGHDATGLKAGEYLFTSGQSPRDILGQISRGEIVLRQVVIPEGFALYQIKAVFAKEPLLTGPFPTNIIEGSIFPSAERFDKGETQAAVVARMQKRMTETLDAEWAKRARNLPFSTKEQALVLASIVEEETGVPEERGRVAAVFVNRLRDGMKLQTDPTVVYGIERARGGAMGRLLTTNDLARDHPWNTYTREGLPPTPICSPGLDSIKAVLNPPSTDEYYFVAKGDGGHYFAKDVKGHQANIVKYKAKLRELKTVDKQIK